MADLYASIPSSICYVAFLRVPRVLKASASFGFSYMYLLKHTAAFERLFSAIRAQPRL
jgi:hypothetical protein